MPRHRPGHEVTCRYLPVTAPWRPCCRRSWRVDRSSQVSLLHNHVFGIYVEFEVAGTTDEAAGERKIIRHVLGRAAVRCVLATVVHATVKIVPLDAPLLNLIVNESPVFN